MTVLTWKMREACKGRRNKLMEPARNSRKWQYKRILVKIGVPEKGFSFDCWRQQKRILYDFITEKEAVLTDEQVFMYNLVQKY